MFQESTGTGPPQFRGNLLISSSPSKAEVLEALKADVYAKDGVWDMDKVSCTVLGATRSDKSHQLQIIPFNSLFRTGLRESNLMAPFGSPTATKPPSELMRRAKVTTVASFGPDHFLENLVVRQDGSMLISVLSHKQLCYIPPPTSESVDPVVLHTFDQNVMGIVEAEPDIFYIATCNVFTDHLSFLHRLDLRTFSLAAPPKPVQVLQFPERVRALNGSTCLSPHVILVADSLANLIWRVDLLPTSHPTARVWLAHESMACSTNPELADCPGVNGIKYCAKNEHIYYTTTVQKRFSRVRVDARTLEAVGEPELVAGGMMGDDFMIDEDADVAYVTTHRENSIQRLSLQPGRENICVVGNPVDELLIGPTAGAWGRQAGDMGKVAYFTSDGGMKRLLPDGIIRSAKVVKVEFDQMT